jgi:hypothetical protein
MVIGKTHRYLLAASILGLVTGCAIRIGSKTLKLSFENTLQSYDSTIQKSTIWEVKGMANDPKDIKYYIYTYDNFVIYIHPYTKLVYSHKGEVIGFVDTERIIRLHNPYKGWDNINRSPVGEIKNPYEGKYLPDFSTYQTPKHKVSR